MTAFEKAADEIDSKYYTGEAVQENCIEWIKGSQTATVTFPKSRFSIKVTKLAEQYPDEVQICHVNKDGSIVAHIPVKYIRLQRPSQRVCTEEERQMLRERLKTNRAKGRKGSNFDSDGLKV